MSWWSCTEQGCAPLMSTCCRVSCRKTGALVLFCPVCGVAFSEPPRPFDTDGMMLRLDELAPEGVIPATQGDIETAGITEMVELDEMVTSWVEEVLWQPSDRDETEEETTKRHFDRWYQGDRS
jgi:hypothetical protein